MVNIKVAVRIRPLSKRELQLGEDVIVRKENKSVLVTNPKIPERQDGDSRQRTRRFAVDFCYDPTDPEGSSQEVVYKEIGSEVLDSMFEGYNACVLAYGHSASGKTYTIMGIQEDPGLTPRLCRGLFEKLEERYLSERIRVQIIISFLEIYNEKVRDLLGSEETTAAGSSFSLRVREHPKLGPYVQGLSEHLVTNKSKLLELLSTGNRRRSTAATENNTHSSRSHAVFTIQFKQCDGENFETEKSSKVHLVDLAGSLQEVSLQETQIDERASSSQSKERLKEGANINKSLVTLGNVVSALAESGESGTFLKAHSNSKSWHPFVPYRDSVLTWLLKDTLGGNSNTIMIATISPASSCLSETVNTLRYAKRTKRIVNQPIVNEDPKIRTIRQLRQEIARLKRLLVSYQSSGSWSEFEESYLENTNLFPTPESKWLDPGGKKVTNKEVYWNEYEKQPKSTEGKDQDDEGRSESENPIGIKFYKSDEEQKKFEDIESSENECEEGVLGQGAALLEGDACKINDEKKSDVNGSVNDNFSHGTQIFSDSLESFFPIFVKNGNACEVAHDESGLGVIKNACEIRETFAGKFNLCLTRGCDSYENPSKKISEMLHRSRPDLIKGISARSKEGPPSGSSQSCTDVSNLSQSTSENSLNSSGSVDIPLLEKRLEGPQDRGAKNSRVSQRVGGEREENGAKRRGEGNTSTPKKTEKRSEIVEAVTSRLYVARKKPNHRGVVAKQPVGGHGELEELKLCKRARMKLFDLSRKFAMTRKTKKTADNDTQTDNMTTTLRVKEKCVTTDPRGSSDAEEIGFSEGNSKEEKPCVIMNQVFIPRSSNYVVECGKVVRIEPPEAAGKHESATQTVSEVRSQKNANTSPIEFNFCEEDCFSEDSLDLEDKPRHCEQTITANEKNMDFERKVSFNWPPDSEIYFSCDSEKRFREKSKIQDEKSKEVSFSGWPLIFLSEGTTSQGEGTGPLLSDTCDISSEEWKKEDNISSENSFTSVDGTDVSCSSETSSEDFVFYESSKDKDSPPKFKLRVDHELYTITENSEQSDPSDAFSPVQSQVSSLNAPQRNEAENPRDRRQGDTLQNERNMPDRSIDVNSLTNFRDEFIESKHACGEYKIERKISAEEAGKIFTTFMQTSNSNKIESENLKVPKPISFFTMGTTSKTPERVPKFAEGSDARNETELKYSDPFGSGLDEGLRRRFNSNKTDSVSWADFQSNSQKQYFNLNISSGNIATTPAFSVDTHLFGKASRKDQNADAMFNSADSITFVFMGPAKPKTSVLMEIIGRSLGKSLSPSDESSYVRRKSRNKGVQCDTNLMRSVSVDSAMIALSRIAKNQEASSGLRRTASLRTLNPNETPPTLSQRNFQDQEENYSPETFDRENKRSALKYSVPSGTNSVEKMINKKKDETEKTKKSVSWSEEEKHEKDLEWEASEIDPNSRGSLELETEDSNEENPSGLSHEGRRRVRFLSRETRNLAKIANSLDSATESADTVDPLKVFLKEATQLLKYINFCSSKNPDFLSKTVAGFTVEGNQMVEENLRIHELSKSKNLDSSTERSKTESCRISEKNPSWRSKTGAPEAELKAGNLTWPRMRPTAGKPPTGLKAKFPVLSDSFHLNGFSDSTRNFSQSNRTGSSAQLRNLSNLPPPTRLENQNRPSSSRSSCCSEFLKCGWIGDSYSSPPSASSRSSVPPLTLDFISELETDIEESCRRLEMAVERDRMRENQQTGSEWFKNEGRHCCGAGITEDEFQKKKMEAREVIRRRKPENCTEKCTCRASRVDPCKYLWSKGCRSSFELDSYGPGSSHCHQLCLFCRKKDAETYYSALNLNSKCSSDLCRLNYYGFCPCSSARLSHVTSSPRAYMQRLLALRRQIVSQSKREQFDAKISKSRQDEEARSLDYFL